MSLNVCICKRKCISIFILTVNILYSHWDIRVTYKVRSKCYIIAICDKIGFYLLQIPTSNKSMNWEFYVLYYKIQQNNIYIYICRRCYHLYISNVKGWIEYRLQVCIDNIFNWYLDDFTISVDSDKLLLATQVKNVGVWVNNGLGLDDYAGKCFIIFTCVVD